MVETVDPTLDAEPVVPRTLSRRRLVKGAAWTVPTVAIVVGVPTAAVASPGGSSLAATFNTDSFRTDNDGDFKEGVPVDSSYEAGIVIDLQASGTPIPDLTATFAGNVGARTALTLPDNPAGGNRGATHWDPHQGSLAADGWSVNPTPGTGDAPPYVFTQAVTNFKAGQLRFILGSLPTGARSIGTLTFNSSNFIAPVVVALATTATSPFITGVVL